MTDIKFKAVKVQGKVTKSHRLPIKRLIGLQSFHSKLMNVKL